LNPATSHKFARFISTIFVPPSFTLLLFTFFAIYLEHDVQKISETIIIATIFGFILPIVLFVILKNKGRIIDVDASIKEERTLPFFIAIIFYVIGLILMLYFKLNIITIAFWFCYISNTLITIVINHYWKISAHSMGASGPFASLFFAIGFWAFLFLPIVLVVGWSRIKLNCHTFSQVFAGFIIAFFSTLIQMYLIIHYLG
jgi:membrane-associated phospholipid phosphatase